MTIARLSAAAAVALAALLPSGAHAAGEGCTSELNVYSVNVPGFVDCSIASTGRFVGRVGDCTSAYQPLQPPFGSQVAPQTQAYADCLA
jgi:hypothetical protein